MKKCNILAITLVLFSNYALANYDFLGQVNVQTNQLGTHSVEGNKYFGGFDFYYADSQSKTLRKTVSFDSKITDSEEFVYSIQEAKFEYAGKYFDLAFGRMLLKWSPVDSIWGLGLVNNRQNFDLYDLGQEGLTGISLSFGTESLKLSLFASYLYVPEMYPSVDVKDGKVTSKSAWCSPVQSLYRYSESKNLDIYYKLNMPKIEEIVLRPTFGLNLTTESEFSELSIFAMRKPENTQRLYVEAGYNVDTARIEADILPVFVDTNVLGASFTAKYLDYKLYFSTINYFPDTMKYDLNPDIYQLVDDRSKKNYIGFGANKTNDFLTIGFNYLQEVTNSSDENAINYKNRFGKAFNFNFGAMLAKNLNIGLDFKYDLSTKDQIIQNQATYKMDKNMTLGVGYKVISAANDDSYWAPFRDRDMAYSNLTYVF